MHEIVEIVNNIFFIMLTVERLEVNDTDVCSREGRKLVY